MAAAFDARYTDAAPASSTVSFTVQIEPGVNVVAAYAGLATGKVFSSATLDGNTMTVRENNTSIAVNQPFVLLEWDDAGSSRTGTLALTYNATPFRAAADVWNLENVSYVSSGTNQGSQSLTVALTTASGDYAVGGSYFRDDNYVAGTATVSGYSTKDADAAVEGTRYQVGAHNFSTGAGTTNLNVDMQESTFFEHIAVAGVYRGATDTPIAFDDLTFALTLPAISITVGRAVNFDDLTYSLTLPDIAISAGRAVNFDDLSFGLTLPNITISTGIFVTLDDLAFALTLEDISISAGRIVAFDDLSFGLTLPNITITSGIVLAADDLAFSLTLPDITISAARKFDANDLAFALTLPDVLVNVDRPIIFDDLAFALTLPDVQITASKALAADDLSFALTLPNISIIASNVSTGRIAAVSNADNTGTISGRRGAGTISGLRGAGALGENHG